MRNPEASITVRVDPSNPGQFFACCGLLELADRLSPGALGWFEAGQFCINCTVTLEELITKIADTPLVQLDKEDDKTSPLQIVAPFNLRLDWWNDVLSGGKELKTWAGQQKIQNIIAELRSSAHKLLITIRDNDLKFILWRSTNDGNLPLYYDSDIGGHSSSLDVGYSLDALGMRSSIRPFLELLAFVAFQRFSPYRIKKGVYEYRIWNEALSPMIAACVVNGSIQMRSTLFEFSLLYRTEYLKSFLPAKPR